KADADLSGANSSPSGPLHPTRRAAGLGPRWPRPPHPGHISSWPKREGSQAAARQLRSNNRAAAWSLQSPLCAVRCASPFLAPTIPLAWAEDRALLAGLPLADLAGEHPATNLGPLFHVGVHSCLLPHGVRSRV